MTASTSRPDSLAIAAALVGALGIVGASADCARRLVEVQAADPAPASHGDPLVPAVYSINVIAGPPAWVAVQ